MKSGVWGEEQACAFLENAQYRILARNYHCRYGEIDIIAQKEGYLAFVEVKTRRNTHFAAAREHVDERKQRRICLTAQIWLQEHPQQEQPRFDVIEVYGTAEDAAPRKIVHLENAFEEIS